MHRTFAQALHLVLCGIGLITAGLRSAGASTTSPVIAIFVIPSAMSVFLPGCGSDCEYVPAAYINWMASAGARSVPISYDASTEEVHRVLDGVNGLMFPGGTVNSSPAATAALEYAVELNKNGDFFPVWGTCLGFEWVIKMRVGNEQVVSEGFDSGNMTRPLGLLPGAEDSRILSDFPADLLEKATVEPIAFHNHERGIPPGALKSLDLEHKIRVLAVNKDRAGKQFVSMAEVIDMPFYGVQWHPEKAAFEWGAGPDGTPIWSINHSIEALDVSHLLAKFFISQARRNEHVLPDPSLWESCMFHNLQATPTSPFFDQCYEFFPKKSFANYSCAAFSARRHHVERVRHVLQS